MKPLIESILDDEEDLIDNTDYLSTVKFPKYSDLNNKTLSRPSHWGRNDLTVNKSYEWSIPKNIRKNYMVRGNKYFEKIHKDFTPYRFQIFIDPSHQHLGLKIYAEEINEYDRNSIEEYYISLFVWDIPSSVKSKYRIIAYNVLEILATHPDALEYILIDKSNNPRMDYYFYQYGINVDDLFKKYDWTIKKYK